MMGYFKPLRRRIGLITLVIACAFTAGWVRSFHICDCIAFSNDDRSYHQLFSSANWFGWIMVPCTRGTLPNTYRTSVHGWRSSSVDNRTRAEGFIELAHTHLEFEGVFSRVCYSNVANLHLMVTYPSIVIPLAILSAYLLLSKPHQRPTQPASSSQALPQSTV